MPLVRIWYKENVPNKTRESDFHFVAESDVILDEVDDVGHVVLERDQLIVLRERIDETLKESEQNGGKEDKNLSS